MAPPPPSEPIEVEFMWWIHRVKHITIKFLCEFTASSSAHDNHHSSGLAEFAHRSCIWSKSISYSECHRKTTQSWWRATSRWNPARSRCSRRCSLLWAQLNQDSMSFVLCVFFIIIEQGNVAGTRWMPSASVAYAAIVFAVWRSPKIRHTATTNLSFQSPFKCRSIGWSNCQLF